MRESPVSSCEVVISEDRKTVMSYILPQSSLAPPKKKLLQSESKLQEKRRLWIIAVSQNLLLHHARSYSEEIRDFYILPRWDELENSYDLGRSEVKSARPEDFDILTTIGRGSFGRVFQVRHKNTAKIYAMKVLKKEDIRKKNEVKHTMAELSVLKSNINHPFLVSLHFSFQNKEKLYFVLDHINGGELFTHIQKDGKFPEDRCRFYAAQIASALGYLHKNSIIYRDLKPENLLLDKHGYIVLTDFGLCKEGIVGNDTTKTYCGTPDYMAPEVILRKPYDRTVDWWSLGIVIYEMLFGLPPFYSRDQSETFDRILNRPLQVRHSVSAASTDIITQLLNKDRTKRLGAKNDFEEINNHSFFVSIEWEKLLRRKIRAPFDPKIRDEADVSHISKDFTTEKFNQASLVPSNLAATQRDHDFPGFTFVEKAHFG